MKLDFTPEVGDQVTVFGFNGEFMIQDRSLGADGNWRFRLSSDFSGLELEDVTYPKLTYSDLGTIRKVLPQILSECTPWPLDLERAPNAASLRYEISSGEMRDGTPKVIVSFFANPEVSPTLANADSRLVFYKKLRDRLRVLLDIESWIQIATKEGRSLLSAAS